MEVLYIKYSSQILVFMCITLCPVSLSRTLSHCLILLLYFVMWSSFLRVLNFALFDHHCGILMSRC
jgi:tryptophan-rich sensory protein